MPDTAGDLGVTPAQVDAAMTAARAFVGIDARSLATVNIAVSLPQLRILVLVAAREETNLTAVAKSLDVHPSNATRTCDRLVHAGLLERAESAADRRQLRLGLTPAGARLVSSVMAHRREALHRVLDRMPAAARRRLVPGLRAFAEAAGEVPDDGTWGTPGSPATVR